MLIDSILVQDRQSNESHLYVERLLDAYQDDSPEESAGRVYVGSTFYPRLIALLREADRAVGR